MRVDVELRKADGRREVEALDRPDPGAPSHPIVVPRRVLQRFLGNGPGRGGPADSDDEEEAEEDEEGGKNEKAAEEAGEKEASGADKENGEPAKAEAAKGKADEAEAEEVQLTDDNDDAEGDEDEDDADDEDMALVDPSRLTRDSSPEAQGCTAVVVLCVRPKDGGACKLYCANAGDQPLPGASTMVMIMTMTVIMLTLLVLLLALVPQAITLVNAVNASGGNT